MVFKSKKQLKKLSDREFYEDIKKYIKSSHEFYGTKVPELRVLAKRLNEEYKLRGFYKIFNKFWKTGYHSERSLAIYTLELYKEEFNLETWKFFKTKLKDIKSWDKLDSVSISIIGEILIREKRIEKDILDMARSNNIWFKRMALMSTIPLIRKQDIKLATQICDMLIYNKDENIQIAIGMVLNEVTIQKPLIARKFILRNRKMPYPTFIAATENLRDLRSIRKENNGVLLNKIMFWK